MVVVIEQAVEAKVDSEGTPTADEIRRDVWLLHDPHDSRQVNNLRTFLLYADAASTVQLKQKRLSGERHVWAINEDGKEVCFTFSARYLHLNAAIDKLMKDAKEWKTMKRPKNEEEA